MSGNDKSTRGKKRTIIAVQAIILAVVLAVFAFIEVKIFSLDEEKVQKELLNSPPVVSPDLIQQTPPVNQGNNPIETQPPVESAAPVLSYEPYAVAETKPENFISGTAVNVNGALVDSYTAEKQMNFGYPTEYTAMKGITTFRGDNFRSGASYGTADIVNKKFGTYWSRGTGALTSYTGYTWTGSGWTGQPLIVEWDKETRAIMNMYDWAKTQESLVEVVYATMDGNVYFTELTTGKQTRDNLYLGFTFKGSGTLDPRGYPILYVGAGYYGASSSPRALAVSLIDGSVLFELGSTESFALRQWHMFDSAPLVSAETDQLIWPGENGIIYIVDLNSDFDKAAGTISVEPEVTKWRYSSIRNTNTGGQYWLGMEDSAVIWQHYLIIGDNGGNLMCLDLNTLELVWVQDVLDDTNCTPVLEIEDGHPYVYISTSFHYGWRSYTTATIPIWKIDAVTGEIVWQVDYTCQTVQDVSGGVQGSAALGEHKLAGILYVPVARTPSGGGGVLAAIDTKSGDLLWELKTQTYSWSSPTAVYDSEGNGYLIYFTSGGYLLLVDGLTGEILHELSFGSTIEASAAVYENTVVFGTRGQSIIGIELT